MKFMNVSGGFRASALKDVLGKKIELIVNGKRSFGTWVLRGSTLEFIEAPRSRRLRKKK